MAVAQKYDYKVELYDQMHDSPVQAKFRKIAPFPVGCVYIQRPGENEKEIREHFLTMRELGFTALKQIMNCPGWTREEIALIALDEGIIPWWYGEGGWQEINDKLLDHLDIPRNMPIEQIRTHPKMVEYQTNLLKKRLKKTIQWQKEGKFFENVGSVPDIGDIGPELSDEGKMLFVRWLKKQYETINDLNRAWNQQHFGVTPDEGNPFSSWKDFEKQWERISTKEYRHLRDIFRFKADSRIELIRRSAEKYLEFDEHAPFRAGGEAGMFLPLAYRGVDMEGIADLLTRYGSFYPSIHLAWHFEQVDYEILRPHYMQAALTNDYFKGGWAASWESTGGPQQFSGGEGGNTFTVDENTMTQLMLNFLAAGYKGFGFWSWSARTAGWEAGEFSLLDRNNKVTPRAIRVGQIGRTARKYRDDLWKAHKEPLVGVYCDWDNEAIWAAMSVRGRDQFRDNPVLARIGVSRALINANIPFEYVTASDLRKGLGPRYRIIYMPSVIAVPHDILDILSAYVRNGGRLVIDMPSVYYDENGTLLPTAKGTVFEKTFGVVINEYQGAGVNRPYKLNGMDLSGFVVRMTPTNADVLADFDSGLPAITSCKTGKGSAVVLGYEASMACLKPGNLAAEKMLLSFTMGEYKSPFQCAGAIVYRLAAHEKDFYFLINDGPQKTVELETSFKYREMMDAISGDKLFLKDKIKLDAWNGRWLVGLK